MSAPNPQKGEGEFRGLKLLMDFDTFAALEGVTGKKMPRLCTEFELGLGLNDMVQWLCCFAVSEVSEKDAKAAICPPDSGMMANYAAFNEVMKKMMDGFFRPEEVNGKKRPPKAA